jgi:hypothetical protein
MSANKTRGRRGAASSAASRTMRRSQIVIAITVLLSVMTAWTMLGYSGGLQTASDRKATNVQTPSPASLNANSPSKEYVYAGARLVATESDFSIFPTYQSFAGNGGSSSISVTAPSGVPWTAVSNATNFVTITSGSSGTGNGTVTYSVGVNPGSTIRQGTITVNSQTFTVYQGINFTDVPTSDPFYSDIGKLAARGVTLGCGGGDYCPNDPVTREQMSAFILRSKGEFDPPLPATQRFLDVPPGNPFYSFIDRLAVLQITLGCGGGNYCPSSPVLREQMAAFILRALGEFDPPTPPTQRFGDVPPQNPFYNFIDRMAARNITQGCSTSPPLYCPASTVTRAQMAAFLVRAFAL